jgi:two-component system chemotaxis response regulator CheY
MATLLVIDDEIQLRETICELLTLAGHTVLEACDGKDGLNKVQQYAPDLILCDVMMPILDGYGFMEAHQKSIYSSIPVFFLTAMVEQSYQDKAGDLGVKAYIKKPFVFKELDKMISCYLLAERIMY